jgi:hypothetical protein
VSITEVATTMRTRLLPVGALDVDDMQREPRAGFVLPIHQGSDVFNPVSTSTTAEPGPPGDKHVFQNLNQEDAETHNLAMVSDRRGQFGSGDFC